MTASRCYRSVLLAGVLGILSFFNATASSDPKQESDSVIEVRKAAETAEVHGIAVSQPAISRFRDAQNWPKVFEVLIAGKGPAGWVREYMPERVKKLTVDDGIVEKLALRSPPRAVNDLKPDFVGGANEILDDLEFYTDEAFKGVKLPNEVKRLLALGKKRTAWQTACMNWRLLELVFPEAIPELPPRFRTIRVQVREGKDVILVLSCASMCHWEVVVKPGGKVMGVILCGTHPQDVEFIENPVEVPLVYRADFDVYGVRRMKPGEEHFDGYELRDRPDKKFETRQKFEAGIKKLTGKEFSSMQRENSPQPETEPYIIRPGSK